MKTAAFILLAGLVGNSPAYPQQQTNDPMADAQRLLEKTMQEFLKNPDAAAIVRSNIAASATSPAVVAQSPSLTEPTSVPFVSPVVPAVPPAPANPAAPPPVVGDSASSRSFAEMERMYLDGKISAKEFQKYLRDQKLRPVQGEGPLPATAKPVKPAPTLTDTNAPVLTPVGPSPGTMTDVEKRLDELIRAQEAREKAATNKVSTTTGPKTKREKLDDLLKQLVEGKISDEDYKAQREKILAEPE